MNIHGKKSDISELEQELFYNEYETLDETLDNSEAAAVLFKNKADPDDGYDDTAVEPEQSSPTEAVKDDTAETQNSEQPESDEEIIDDKAEDKTEAEEKSDVNPIGKRDKSADPAEELKAIAEELSDDSQDDDSADSKKKKRRKSKKDKKFKADKDYKPKGKGRYITPLIVLATILMIIIGCVYNIYYCDVNFDVNFYQVESMHVSSDVRIAVISDVHLSEYGEDNSRLVEEIKSLNPDLIISAGDLVTYGEENYDNMLSLCRQLAEIAPFYGVMGNHEDEKVYLEGDSQLRYRFEETGMRLIVNRVRKLKINGNDIEIVGVSGDADGFLQYGGKEVMDSLGDNTSALRICVAHVPTLFDECLRDYDFDLGIAGHTHGGVVRLPMIGGLYSAEEGFLPEYDGGLYDLDNNSVLFVSRGLGNSGKIPRFNNTPELAVIDVRWY